MKQGLIAHDKVKQFMLSGKALVVIHSLKTGDSYRYHIKAKKHTNNLFYIYFGTFSDYIGFISAEKLQLKYPTNASAKVNKGIEVFEWTWKHIDNLPASVEIYHTGICGTCGRALTDATSIIFGIGPECRKKLGL